MVRCLKQGFCQVGWDLHVQNLTSQSINFIGMQIVHVVEYVVSILHRGVRHDIGLHYGVEVL